MKTRIIYHQLYPNHAIIILTPPPTRNTYMTETHQELMELLNRGVTQAQAAKVLSVSPGRISQMVKELPEGEATSKELAYDIKLQGVEESALDKVSTTLPLIQDPLKAARVFSILNSAKRRSDPRETPINTQTNIVVLQLPEVVKSKITTNSNNEVVQIDGRPLISINSELLLQNNRKEKNHEQERLGSLGSLEEVASQ